MIEKEPGSGKMPITLAHCFFLGCRRAFLEAVSFFLAHGVLNLAGRALPYWDYYGRGYCI